MDVGVGVRLESPLATHCTFQGAPWPTFFVILAMTAGGATTAAFVLLRECYYNGAAACRVDRVDRKRRVEDLQSKAGPRAGAEAKSFVPFRSVSVTMRYVTLRCAERDPTAAKPVAKMHQTGGP